jgi:hypothetical protein
MQKVSTPTLAYVDTIDRASAKVIKRFLHLYLSATTFSTMTCVNQHKRHSAKALSVIMLSVAFSFCYAECRYAECHNAERRSAVIYAWFSGDKQ